MTYQTTRTRFDFDTVAALSSCRRSSTTMSQSSRKLARLRAAKKALHFLGFLCYWAIALSIGFLVIIASITLFIFLA